MKPDDPDSTGGGPAPPRPTRREHRRATRPMTVRGHLHVVVTDGRGHRLPGRALRAWLVAVAPRSARGELALALVADPTMRALNKRYRGQDRTTDVLSFPAGPQPRLPKTAPRILGDIVIAKGVAARHARVAGHSLQTELRCLALHGLLHVLGYDHERDDGRMRRVERRLLRRGGIRQGAAS